MATLTAGATPLNTDQVNLAKVLYGAVAVADAGHIRFTYSDGSSDDLYGSFTYSSGALSGGTLTRAVEAIGSGTVFDLNGFSLPVTSFVALVNANDSQGALTQALSGADSLTGSRGDDVLRGFAGDDLFVASGGNDLYDGGAGTNTVRLSGVYTLYTVTPTAAGSWVVADTRAQAPDGRMTLTSVQRLQFADSTLTAANAPSSATVNTLETAFANVTRASVLAAATQTATLTLADGTTVANPLYTQRTGLLDLAASVDTGGATAQAATRQVEHYADATTSVATLAYQFFTGKTPSAAGYDYLVSSTTNANDLNDPYYARFTQENRYINFAVNLGKFGEGAPTFTARYGGLSLGDSLKGAYFEIFGFAADDAKVSAILNAPTGIAGVPTRADYFAAYGGDGANGIGTKAAMVGFLLVEAVKADLGTYAKANDAFLDALAVGGAQYNIDLKGLYGPASAPLVGVHDGGLAG